MDRKLPPTNAVAAMEDDDPNPTTSAAISTNDTTTNAGEIPFLVTHWLANYVRQQKKELPDAEQRAIIDKISSATNEIASAFSSLGAYGTTVDPTFGTTAVMQSNTRNASYSDLSRKWSGLPASHLENLAQAVVNNGNTAAVASQSSIHTNLLLSAGESKENNNKEGRTVMDAIEVEVDGGGKGKDEPLASIMSGSILQKPVLLSSNSNTKMGLNKDEGKSPVRVAEASPNPMTAMEVQSSYEDVAKKTANVLRNYLDLRQTVQSSDDEIKSLEISINKQEEKWKASDARFHEVSVDPDLDSCRKLHILDDIKNEKQNCERIVAQLRRKITELKTKSNHSARTKQLSKLRAEAKSLESKRKAIVRHFRDPIGERNGSQHQSSNEMGNNYLLHAVLSRQHGLPRSRRRPLPLQSPITKGIKPLQIASMKKALIGSRFSVSASINSHLSYPVYCLRFDRTGRYFVTGADDYLIKVFYLGAGRSCRTKSAVDGNRELRCNYGANIQGAVLVCSLRGHAGVINDIDVSSDNCFLGTASVDGDVRVWGLKDGCPIAILRGHSGGANMISWSTLTPYRLVTTGSDGFARVWDIRDACLKRYGALVGKRSEYRLKLTSSEKKEDLDHDSATHPREQANGSESRNLLPPLPTRVGASGSGEPGVVGSPTSDRPTRSQPNGIAVPALPPAVPPLPDAQAAAAPAVNIDGNGGEQNNANAAQQQQGDAPAPGQFVANDNIDEGVRLLRKYKHGTTGEDVAGPATRSRRAVNVICVAKCPVGGTFTTGSDDGICRVWEDEEDNRVAIVDRRDSHRLDSKMPCAVPRLRNTGTGQPLVKLMGHISAVTDLAYSSAGDRILSASQKDGVIRIWSIGNSIWRGNEKGVAQVVIKLTDPNGPQKVSHPRRAPGNAARTETSKVSCDVAVWTNDDAYIVSSQSILVKQSSTEVQPGSQYLFLWNSHTGQCLMGFSGAHKMQCPVVIPHPDDSSLVCTAAADGYARLWDWGTGRCIFTHKNKELTNQDSSNGSKLSGFLDGAWGPCGTTVVLTDDSGCVTILDCSDKREDTSQAWMKDQYFANDYYELFYDTNGYCIERGSERPPHLAPRGVRCNHSGAPWSDEINETFAKLVGPLPIPEDITRRNRERIRSKALVAVTRTKAGSALADRHNKVRRGVREFDPSSTIMVRASGHVEHGDSKSRSRSVQFGTGRASSERAEQTRAMSSNFRYLGYDDIIRRQGDPNDVDSASSVDEEFVPGSRNNTVNAQDSDESEDEPLDVDEAEYESPRRLGGRRSRRSGATARAREQRAQRRARVRDDFMDIGSEDEAVIEYMSTNNTPSGPYERDYNLSNHFWRAPPSGGKIRRKWLCRPESDASYSGQKIYSPQIGDSVVYIPRAHYETLKDFPSLTPPWQHWPHEAVWPVVRCFVRGVRYRFPYEDYFRGRQTRCTSIVAILTLEVTGIPQLSGEREFPWPRPSFVEPSRRHLFELSLFESNNCEYLFPTSLYIGRLQALEASVRQHDMHFQGLGVHLYYSEAQTNSREDTPMREYDATILGLEEEGRSNDPHLMGSGFGTIKADCENHWDTWSPWEIIVDNSTSERPCLTEEGKKFLLDNLNQQLRKPNVRDYFSMAVDENRYSDYARMVEVEMNMMFIKRRLGANYYCSKLSVVSDLRLIRDNCIKYNTIQNELSQVACTVVEAFETAVLSSNERSMLITEEEFERFADDSQHATGVREGASAQGPDLNAADMYSTTQTISLRIGTDRNGQSSLENLPRARPARRAASIGSPDRATRRSARARGQEPSGNQLETEPRRPRRARGQQSGEDSLARITRSGMERRRGTERRESQSRVDDEEDEMMVQDEAQRQIRGSARNAIRATRAGGVANNGGQDGDDDEESDDAVESTFASRRRISRRRPVRDREAGTRSRRTAVASDESDRNDDDDEEEEEEEGSEEEVGTTRASRTRISVRSGGRSNKISREHQNVGSSPRSNRRTTSRDLSPESPTRRSRRAGARSRKSYEEASDSESPEESSAEEESEPDETPPSKRQRHSRAIQDDESEFDSEEEEEEGDEEEDDDDDDEPSHPPPRATRKRRNAASPASRGKKKTRHTPSSPGLAELSEWPEVEMKDITCVCEAVVARVAEADVDDVFKLPVVEVHPDISENYLKIIENPMDLRTIEDERIPGYKSISELQQDLILMFNNCVVYNGKRGILAKYAIKIRGRINTIFQEVCEDEDVLLPRRWNP